MTDDVRATPIRGRFRHRPHQRHPHRLVFAVALWQVGAQSRSLDSHPGYLVWAAALYGLIASVLTFFVGRPLIDAAERKNAAEAQSRYELVRVRENAASIALIGGADDEREKFAAR